MKRAGQFYFGLVLMLSALLLIACGKTEKPADAAPYLDYMVKEPFHLMVSKNYPDDLSMMLARTGGREVFSLDYDGKKLSRAGVAVEPEVSASIELTEDEHPRELMVILSLPHRKVQILRDLNLDGIWVLKLYADDNRYFINVNKEWESVETIHGKWPDITASNEEGTYSFDMNSGAWKLQGPGMR